MGEADISWAVIERVFQTGTPVMSADAVASDELSGHRSIVRLQLKSLLCLPVRSAGATVGALYLHHRGMAGAFGSAAREYTRRAAAVLGLLDVTREAVRRAATVSGDAAGLRDQLLRLQRTRVVAELVSGCAHDLKNVLSVIAARTQMGLQGTADSRARAAFAGIDKAARAGCELLSRLQNCARHGVVQTAANADLGEIAKECVELIEPKIQMTEISGGKRLAVVFEGAAGTNVAMPEGELREAILNLCLNGCDAMPNGGVLSVSVSRVDGEARGRVCIQDSGVGIPVELQARVFEPFFTTKGAAGSGLGLSIAKEAIGRYGGELRARNRTT